MIFAFFLRGGTPLWVPHRFCRRRWAWDHFLPLFFLEKNFKRSNPFKRQIPRYISIKYRSTILDFCIFSLYFYISVMLQLTNIGAGYFAIKSILAKIAFSFFFWTFKLSQMCLFWLISLD